MCVRVFPGWSTAVVALFSGSFFVQSSSLFWEFEKKFAVGFFWVCGSKNWFACFFSWLMPWPFHFPFWNSATLWFSVELQFGFTMICKAMTFASIYKMGLSVSLCMCAWKTFLELFLKNRKFVQSGVTAFKQTMLVVLLWLLWWSPPRPLEPANHQKKILVAQKDCGGGGGRWVDNQIDRDGERDARGASWIKHHRPVWEVVWQSRKPQKVSQPWDKSAGKACTEL